MFRSDLGRREFLLNPLSQQVFGKRMFFQISLSLLDLQVIIDWFRVGMSLKHLEQIVTVAYLKKTATGVTL